MTDAAPRRYFALSRVEAYTDGVFAIAATLLVLDLTANSIGAVDTDAQLWSALAGMWPNILGFAISFALLSMLWVVHLQQFRDVARADTGLIWLNNARLLFIVLIPFTTSLTAEYNSLLAGRMLLPVNFFVASLLGYASWAWAASRDGHLMRDEVRGTVRVRNLGGISAVICGAVAALLSPWFGSAAFLAYVFNYPLELALRRITGLRAG